MKNSLAHGRHMISANGLSLAVEIRGYGPRLLFLPGSEADLRKPSNASRSALIDQFEVLTVDPRGLGVSEKPPGPYTMADYAHDTIALLDAVEWQDALVLGYSFGGMVAQELAIRAPNRVKRLVLAGSTAGGAGGSSYPIDQLATLPPAEKALKSMEIQDNAFDARWRAAHPDETAQRIAETVEKQADFADEPGILKGKALQLAARRTHDTYDRLGLITAPTLVLAGRRDGQAPLAAQQAMAAQIPNATMAVMECGHLMFLPGSPCFDRAAIFLLESAN